MSLFREGYKTFFNTLYQNNIPLFIFSAGIGDILEEIIRQMKVFHPNIHIVSNYMDFDEDVSLTSFRLGGWRGGNRQHPSPAAAEPLNPDLGRKGRELLLAVCPQAFTCFFMHTKDTYL